MIEIEHVEVVLKFDWKMNKCEDGELMRKKEDRK